MIIYFIFSHEGLEEATPSIVSDNAILWVNVGFLSEQQFAELNKQNVDVQFFPEHVDGSNEKSILQALKPIEEQAPNAEIFIEYL